MTLTDMCEHDLQLQHCMQCLRTYPARLANEKERHQINLANSIVAEVIIEEKLAKTNARLAEAVADRNSLRKDLDHMAAYYDQFTLTPKATADSAVDTPSDSPLSLMNGPNQTHQAESEDTPKEAAYYGTMSDSSGMEPS